jgi:hypothetical protein
MVAPQLIRTRYLTPSVCVLKAVYMSFLPEHVHKSVLQEKKLIPFFFLGGKGEGSSYVPTYINYKHTKRKVLKKNAKLFIRSR